MLPPPLLAATVAALRAHAPFDAMAPAHLAFFAERLRLRYFAAGARILAPDDGPVAALRIVQRGRVQALHPGRPSDAFTLIEGEVFPVGALIGERPTTLIYSALDDTFCYLLDAADFRALMGMSREFERFCTRRLAHLLAQSERATRESYAERANLEIGLAAPLRVALRRAPVTLPPDAPVRAALERMKAEHVGSIVVVEDERPVGIFTQADVLDRVALAGCRLDEPLSSVMTRAPVSLPATASLAQAAEAMARGGFRHLAVLEGDRLAGVISERDLFALQRRSAKSVRRHVNRADSVEALAHAAREARALTGTLLAQGTAPEPLMRMVTALNDAIAVRAIALSRARHDLGGIAFCWMGLGSEGRMEQTFATDQDNAIVFAAPPSEREAVRERLGPFADEVNRTLDACGFPLCVGDIMARNPRWRLSLDEWMERFDDWMRNAVPEALLHAAIFFDFRAIDGEERLAAELREFLRARSGTRPAFLRLMAQNALEVRPLDLFGQFVAGEDARVDLKMHASRPFVDAARIFALATGVAATATVDRLREAGPALGMPPGDVEAACDAFLFVQMLRLRHQEEGAYTGAASDRNLVDPERLNALDRRILKEALRQARKLQSRLALDYRL